MVPLHLGQLHPLEQALVIALAFGPFVLAGVIVVIIRRRDAAAEASLEQPEGDPSQEGRSAR
jgi:hypothetical protein